MRAVIVGAGIGGLTAAIALQAAGVSVVVLERADELREVGAGIGLAPNAMRALQRIGMAERLLALGTWPPVAEVRASSGLVLQRQRMHLLSKPDGVPGVVVERSTLLAHLLEKVGSEIVQLGRRCVGYRQDERSVVALLDSGEEVAGDLLVGADGIRSTIARTMFGERPLRYAGDYLTSTPTSFPATPTTPDQVGHSPFPDGDQPTIDEKILQADAEALRTLLGRS